MDMDFVGIHRNRPGSGSRGRGQRRDKRSELRQEPAGNAGLGGCNLRFQVPFECLPAGQTSGSVIVIVQRGSLNSPVKSFQVSAFSPGIFSIAGNGLGSANAINPDGALVAPSGSVPGYAA